MIVQTKHFNNVICKKVKMIREMPQGSILGLLLYINKFKNVYLKGSYTICANDTVILYNSYTKTEIGRIMKEGNHITLFAKRKVNQKE